MNQLAILIPIQGNDNKWEEQLSSFLSRTKLTTRIILLGKSEKVRDSKLYRELVPKGTLSAYENPGDAAGNLNAEYVLHLAPAHLSHLGNISSWFNLNRKNLEPASFYLPDSSSKKSDKNKTEGNFAVSVFNFFAKLFTSVQVKGAEHGIWLADSNTAASVMKSMENAGLKSGFEAANKAALLGFSLKNFPLQLKVENSSFPGVFSPFKQFFSSRWYWFVKQPLADMRANGFMNSLTADSSLYRFFFFVLTAIILVMLPALSFDYGITWDEPEDQNYFERVFRYFVTFGEDKSCLDNSHKLNEHLVNYGPFVNLVCITVHRILSKFTDAGLYETRHFVIALFGVIGMIYTGLLARRIANSWKVGFLALLFVFATPFIFGHSMNNQKDIPFMAFYAVSLYYMFGFIIRLPRPDFRTSFFLAIAMGITMSIRIGGLLVFAFLILFMAINWMLEAKNKGFGNAMKLIPRYLVTGLPVLLFAYVVGIIFWPYAIQDPINNPINALKNFEKFSLVQIFEIFEGKRYHMKAFPWYYLPKSILVTAPLFALGGLVLFIVTLFSLVRKHDWRLIAMLAFITIFPLVYVIYKKSAVYSSWRHLYFIYPGIIAMAALGWNEISALVKKSWFRWSVAVILAFLVIKPMIWSVVNHPYQYVYYNEITGGVKGAYGKYETDYWCQSPREAITWLMKNEGLDKKKAFVVSNNESHSMSYYSEPVNKDIVIGWAREQEWGKQNWDYAIWTTRTLSSTQMHNGYFPPKGTIHTITVEGVPLAAIVKKENNDLYLGNQMMDKRNYDSAIMYYESAVKYDPMDEEPWRMMGLSYLSKGMVDKAAPALNKSIELRPENPASYLYLAYVDAENKNLDGALTKAKKCIEYRVNFSQAYELIGNIYINTQQFAEAITWFQKELEWNQGDGAYTGMAKAYMGMNNVDEAINHFYTAVQLNPNSIEANMGLAQCLRQKGDAANAEKYQQRAMQLMGR